MNESLSAPEVALLRTALEAEASGVPLPTGYLVSRTIVGRGILLNPQNRARYVVLLDGLISSGHIVISTAGDLAGDVTVTVTDTGRAALAGQAAGA